MIRLNGVEYEYRPGQTLSELATEQNLIYAKTGFDKCVVIQNSAAVPANKAPELPLNDNDTIFIVPKLDGG